MGATLRIDALCESHMGVTFRMGASLRINALL